MIGNRMLSVWLISAAAVTIAACSDSNRKFRVASVGSQAAAGHAGDQGGSGSGSNTGSGGAGSGSGGGAGGGGGSSGGGSAGGGGGGSSGGSGQGNLIVASGNVLIGAASQYAQLTSSVNGSVPAGGVINGNVVAILKASGQTLVQLGTGTSVLLNGTGGQLGDLVSIDFAQGRVIGGPNALVGVNVLAANPSTGRLATVSAASGNNLVGLTVVKPGSAGGPLVLAPQVAPLLGLQPAGGVTGSVGTTVNSTVNAAIAPKCC